VEPTMSTLLMAVHAALLATCQAAGEPPQADTPPSEQPPRIVSNFQMDPEKPREFRGWWASENALLRVHQNGRYDLWTGRNRFRKPRETGRWHQRNHAVFLLDSYAIPRTTPTRVSMWLRNDALMADVGGLKFPFRKLEQPPLAPEDELIGVWEGAGGRLTLMPNLSYYWEDTSPSGEQPVSIRCQGGDFSYESRQLRMLPSSPRQEPVIVSTTRDEQNRITSFLTNAGSMQRVPMEEAEDSSDQGTAIQSKPDATHAPVK
ncbi:MAG: hypothetical protein MK085_03865, partial [Phycisphaerales bacterium]|nr:hypothetical protein [Phycisphaerales bacterium]